MVQNKKKNNAVLSIPSDKLIGGLALQNFSEQSSLRLF